MISWEYISWDFFSRRRRFALMNWSFIFQTYVWNANHVWSNYDSIILVSDPLWVCRNWIKLDRQGVIPQSMVCETIWYITMGLYFEWAPHQIWSWGSIFLTLGTIHTGNLARPLTIKRKGRGQDDKNTQWSNFSKYGIPIWCWYGFTLTC